LAGSSLSRARNLARAAEASRVAGVALILVGIVFLLANFYRYIGRVSAAASVEELGGVLYDMLVAPLVVIGLGVAFQELSAALRRRAERLEEEFKNEMLGLIEVYGRIRLQDLAARLGLSPRDVESLLARYAREGSFKGVIGEDGYVYSSRDLVVPAPVVPAAAAGEDVERGGGGGTVVVEPGGAQSPEAQPGEGGEAVAGGEEGLPEDVRRELEELERAYREGLISREAYERARRELESRIGRRQ